MVVEDQMRWSTRVRVDVQWSSLIRHRACSFSFSTIFFPLQARSKPWTVEKWWFAGVPARNFSLENGRGSKSKERRSVWIQVRVLGDLEGLCTRPLGFNAVKERKRGGKNVPCSTLDFRSSPINDPRLEFTDSWNGTLLLLYLLLFTRFAPSTRRLCLLAVVWYKER